MGPSAGGRTGKQEETLREVTVFRVDYVRKTKVPIGVVFEKRKAERAHNYHDLLRLARRLFASDTADALHIVIDVRNARDACLPERTRECSAG
jgi:RNase P protein component